MAVETEEKRSQAEQAESEGQQNLVGQIRRLGPDGPAYEIVDLDKTGKVKIEVIDTGETVTCPLAEILKDPMAETIP